jgi:leucine dehydrogenase
MFDHPDFDSHEALHCVHDAPSGLRAIIAVHSTHRGPAGGGCRLRAYASTREALGDALRLSRAMSLKCALAGLPAGGGKTVILAPEGGKTPALFEALGRAVEQLGGRYVAAADMGVTPEDLLHVARHTAHVVGIPSRSGEVGGDSGPPTARGVLAAIVASLPLVFGRAEPAGLTVAIQGVGSVGGRLARLLAARGARLLLADAEAGRAQALAAELGATALPAEAILSAECDILSPNATGGVLGEASIPAIRAPLIVGAANNQLATPEDDARLFGRGILWAPDYAASAGGIIQVMSQYFGERSPEAVEAQVAAIGPRVAGILAQARASGRPTGAVAEAMALKLIGRG